MLSPTGGELPVKRKIRLLLWLWTKAVTLASAADREPSFRSKKQTMKKAILIAMLACSHLYIAAQITVTASTFPAPGDTLRYVQAANPNAAVALYTPPGGNQYWDLSGMTPAVAFETRYRPAAEGVHNAAFPEAGLVVAKGAEEYYYKTSATKFELLGHVDSTVGGLPLLAIYKNQPFLAERRAPLNFFDIYQQTSHNNLAWAYSELPTGALVLSFTPDSIRLRINKQILDVVDGYGTLRLPGALPQSEYPVLRLKRTTYNTVNIDIKLSLLGWVDISQSPPAPGSAWVSLLGTDTITAHHYMNDISKEEIAVVTFNSSQSAVTSVVYKNTLPVTPVVEPQGAGWPRLQVYPNPAVSAVTIRCADAPSGMYKLKIFNSLGALVRESTHPLADNTPIQLELPPDLNGLYFCRLENAKGAMVGTSRLMVFP